MGNHEATYSSQEAGVSLAYSPPKENINLCQCIRVIMGKGHWTADHSALQVPAKCVRNSLLRPSPITGRWQCWMRTHLKVSESGFGRGRSQVHSGASVISLKPCCTHSRHQPAEALGWCQGPRFPWNQNTGGYSLHPHDSKIWELFLLHLWPQARFKSRSGRSHC